MPCCGQVPQHRRGALPQVPGLFHQPIHGGEGDGEKSIEVARRGYNH
jgi:hypothetical protein